MGKENGQKQVRIWLLAILVGVIVFIISFFAIQEPKEETGKWASFVMSAGISGVATGIVAGKPGRGALTAISAVVVVDLILLMLGYRVFESWSGQEAQELSFWQSFEGMLFIGVVEAAFFSSIAAAVTRDIRDWITRRKADKDEEA